MESAFWHEKWERNDIPFHASDANPLLVKHFSALALPEGSRVFVPLCGKTLDIRWLLSNGFRVAGAELSPLAIDQLFAELGAEPAIADVRGATHYSADGIDIFVGDIFELTRETLGPIDAVYDRAALVALPENMRARYTAHLTEITSTAPQLVICYEYDQTALDGPPFSISNDEVRKHYGQSYTLTVLSSSSVAGGLKGKCAATENVWLLTT